MESEKLKPAMLAEQKLQEVDDLSDSLAIGELVAVAMENRYLIAALTLVFLMLGAAYVFVASPTYRADGLIQVEENNDSALSALKDLQPLLGDSTTVEAEQEILTSRMILGRVIKKRKLDISVTPRPFPIVGKAILRKYVGDRVATPWLGLSRFAWGGEEAHVESLDVPPSDLDSSMRLIARGEGEFILLNDDGDEVLKGKVGERVQAGKFAIFVSKLEANPGTRFEVIKYSPELAIKNMLDSLTVKERGKKSGILEVALKGSDRDNIVMVLDDILNAYVRQNVELRSAEAENTLKFLETQLPKLKQEMDAAESAYNSYRQARGSLDLNIETQSVLESIVDVDNQIVALRQERDELRQSFTSEHPRIKAVDNRIERLKERRSKFDTDINKLPATQQRVLQLARDVEVTTNLYTDLVNTAQQLKVSKAGTVGDVRIVDVAAAPSEPVGLKPAAVVAISGLLGLIFSAFVIWIRRSLRVVVEDPETIESKLGLPVYATIPHSAEEVEIAKRGKGAKAGDLLAIRNPEDDAVESLRGLRTTIHFALMDAQHNSILITGSSPGLGKSFISKNLGAVLAQSGKRVVIVDADLRRGHINKEFGLRRELGVSEYVAGTAAFEEIIKPTTIPNLWVITTGQIPPNPSELLMHLRFEALLEKLEEQFDTLIVDAPPILAVSDAAIIGRITGATLMVARASRHPLAELEQALKRLSHAGVQVKGFVFNDLNTGRQRYRYGYKGYVYRYSYKE